MGDQLLNGGPHSGSGVGVDRGHVQLGDRAVDEHERDPPLDEGVQPRSGVSLRGEDHAVDALLQQDAQVAVLLLGVLGGRADERRQPPCEQGGLDGVGELGEEGVAHVRHQEGDDVGARGS